MYVTNVERLSLGKKVDGREEVEKGEGRREIRDKKGE
jgi:hypothetical protein